MTFSSDAARGRAPGFDALSGAFGGEAGDDPDAPKRDTKKLVLIVGLGVLSWVATYVGMLELIEANMGDLPLIHKIIVAFSVGMLMTMIIWLLDQLFAPIGSFTKFCYILGYIFLSIISVGFGFGFYWKVLESRSEASRSAESAVTQVQGSLFAASTRLEQLQATLIQLTSVSNEKAQVEQAKGTSCPNSRPGDGPRRKMREDDAARFGFAAEFVKGRIGTVKGDLSALDGDLAKIASGDKSTFDKSGTRNEFMKALGRKLDLTVTGFNAFRTDPQLRQIRADLAERAEKSSFVDTKGAAYQCPDPQLQQALRGVVRAIDQLPELEKPKIAAVEGSEATIEAFRRLTATFFGLMTLKMPPSADELRELQKKAVQSVETPTAQSRALQSETVGLSKRDYVPLGVALFVDICLLLVSMGRPMNRLHGLLPRMRAAERGPVMQILTRFNDIHRDRQIRENFEIFRHVVFDYAGQYYVAVPLDAPTRISPKEREELRIEAHLLSNLFTSFEKERVFKRVMWPDVRPPVSWFVWANVNAARKRLRRQGSKFAESEAFRIYKFNDGAWSEIILGAVMGAAVRVEAEKRMGRGSDRQPNRTIDISLPMGTERRSWDDERTGGRSQRTGPRSGPPRSAPEQKPSSTERGISRDYERKHGPYAAAAYAEIFGEGEDGASGSPKADNSNTAPSRGNQPENVIGLPAVRPHAPSADAPVSSATPQANVVTELQPLKAAATVDVVVRRETATFSVPVSEARLPEALTGLGRAAVSARLEAPDAPAITMSGSGVEVTNKPQLPPPLPSSGEPRRAGGDADQTGDWGPDSDDFDVKGIAQWFGRRRVEE